MRAAHVRADRVDRAAIITQQKRTRWPGPPKSSAEVTRSFRVLGERLKSRREITRFSIGRRNLRDDRDRRFRLPPQMQISQAEGGEWNLFLQIMPGT